MSTGVFIYITLMVLAGNFLLCTMCSPFCCRKARYLLRGFFAVAFLSITTAGYALFVNP